MRQAVQTDGAFGGSGRFFRLDPSALPVRHGDRSDAFILDRDRAVVRRTLRGLVATLDVPVKAYRGENVAAALLAAGLLRLRTSPRGGARGAFCFMGVCQECTVEHDGRAVSSCQLPCEDGMAIVLRELTDSEH